MKKKLMVLMSLAMIFASAFAFVGAQTVSAHEDEHHKVKVVPAAVTFTNPSCGNQGFYTVPVSEGVKYVLEVHRGDDKTLLPGIHYVETGDKVEIKAHAERGYEIERHAIDKWEWKFVEEDCLVDPAGDVVFTSPTCDLKGYYTITAVTGITYYVDDEVVAAGKYVVDNGKSVTVTAIANEGYYLPDNAESMVWSYTFNALKDCVLGATTTTTVTKLPVTSGSSILANIATFSAFVGLIALLGFAARSVLTSKI